MPYGRLSLKFSLLLNFNKMIELALASASAVEAIIYFDRNLRLKKLK